MRPEVSLKRRLGAGERIAGCFVMVPSPAIVEMVGYAGFDFVVLDREHGAATTETIEHQIRAADAAGIGAIVRVPSGTPVEILHALDAGASGILVPHVTTAAAARAIARAVHYPPFGARGMATTTRAGRHGMVDVATHLERAAQETLLMLQIEDAQALEHVREIAALDDGGGLDITFLGIGQVDRAGNLNVSRFGAEINGPGGFNNITERTRRIVFCGTLTSGGLRVAVEDGRLRIAQEGRHQKFVDRVEQITLNAARAYAKAQQVLYVTERAVFRLGPQGPVLVEVAPGIDVERDVRPFVGFELEIADDLHEMPARVFADGPLGLARDFARRTR